jgi:hypothetical protein
MLRCNRRESAISGHLGPRLEGPLCQVLSPPRVAGCEFTLRGPRLAISSLSEQPAHDAGFIHPPGVGRAFPASAQRFARLHSASLGLFAVRTLLLVISDPAGLVVNLRDE